MKLGKIRNILPSWKNALLAVLAAALLILSFPDFEFWFLAWFALVPLLFAVEREKDSPARSFILGWFFGNLFFFGTCWWLTFAPITYAGFPPALAYFLLFCVTSVAGIFPGIFTTTLSVLLKRFGSRAVFAAPFIWVFTEFLRYWLTGNNWNALGYSQAFGFPGLRSISALGGVLLTSFSLTWICSVLVYAVLGKNKALSFATLTATILFLLGSFGFFVFASSAPFGYDALVVAVQPNVPMSGLSTTSWNDMRKRHITLAADPLRQIDERTLRLWGGRDIDPTKPTMVIFPESPMNFMYEDDQQTRDFINGFAAKNNVSVLFNSAEPDAKTGKYFNSAVMVSPEGREVAQYDKIYLLPFGEAVPFPLEGLLPGFVGNFSYGSEYDLLPIGSDVKAGVMICFESHFGQLSREYVRNGADAIIEMTNDGYLGPTPVLRQHLANAVFRAVETNRPLIRATNVGITETIRGDGSICDSLISCGPEPYTEGTHVSQVAKSDGSQTFYVKYGDWFAWLCTIVTLGILIFGFVNKRSVRNNL